RRVVVVGEDAGGEVGDGRRRGGQGRAGAGGFEARGGAGFQAAMEQVVGLLERRDRALGDLQLQVELAELEVARGDVRDEREQHAAARLLGGQDLCARRLVQAPDAAPQIDLPGDAEVDVVEVLR